MHKGEKRFKLRARCTLETWVENGLVKGSIFQSVFQEILVSHDAPGKRTSGQNSLGIIAFCVLHIHFLGRLLYVLRYCTHVTFCGNKCLIPLTKQSSDLSDMCPFLILLHVASFQCLWKQHLGFYKGMYHLFLYRKAKNIFSLCILTCQHKGGCSSLLRWTVQLS